ncbi:MAG TPA: M12 family metallo-peptidase [Nannocystaceae bacterium]|nr:M12 family metallo-peptidase [Nannocystaceae bacterium]
MNRARLLAIGKLGLLLGVPMGLILTLFGAGVYCGVTHREGITGFEHDVLGLDVEVAKADPVATPATTETPSTPTPATTPTPSTPSTTTPTTTTPTPSTTSSPLPPTITPQPTPTPTTPTPEQPTTPIVEGPAAQVDPLTGTLAEKMQTPVRVRIKVLVDDELTTEHKDWIDYVQRTVSRASQVYEQQFGITLELYAVARWPVATAGLGADQLLDDLRGRSREGADILVGMTARPLDGSISGEAETPTAESPFNGARGIVYSTPRSREPHVRTLLHEVAHMFGALDVTNTNDPAWKAASWMSYAPVRDGQAPWIDADNRRRVLERKDKPFAPDDAPTPSADPENPEL